LLLLLSSSLPLVEGLYPFPVEEEADDPLVLFALLLVFVDSSSVVPAPVELAALA
jgi:hypothetical protein